MLQLEVEVLTSAFLLKISSRRTVHDGIHPLHENANEFLSMKIGNGKLSANLCGGELTVAMLLLSMSLLYGLACCNCCS